ncbi:MAG: hypothetical protein AAF799_10040 [Myxococcota bacterium]
MHPLAHRLGLVLVLAAGCGEATPRSPSTPVRGRPDKAELFGDPTLVPTREGERVRRELGMAREIEHALAVLPAISASRVNVELPQRPSDGARVLAVVNATAPDGPDSVRERIATIIATIVGAKAQAEIVIEEPEAHAPAPPLSFDWPLVLGVLGLGFFAGMFVERARRLRPNGLPRRVR